MVKGFNIFLKVQYTRVNGKKTNKMVMEGKYILMETCTKDNS